MNGGVPSTFRALVSRVEAAERDAAVLRERVRELQDRTDRAEQSARDAWRFARGILRPIRQYATAPDATRRGAGDTTGFRPELEFLTVESRGTLPAAGGTTEEGKG
jgi:hypothetical protein